MNSILVIIPMYGKEEYTKQCIRLTQKNAGIDHDILVVDDGSEKSFKWQGNTIRLEQNSGFTNAINQGILWAQDMGYDYVQFLNNDTEPCADFLKSLLDEMKGNVGIASSIRLHPIGYGSAYGTDYEAGLEGLDLLRGFQRIAPISEIPKEPIECLWSPACSWLLDMDMIREIGLLDKHMRNHSSDLDYCFRARFAGYKTLLVPSSMVIHHLSITTNGMSPALDQQVFLEKLANLKFAEIMKDMPLDAEQRTYGRLDLSTYRK